MNVRKLRLALILFAAITVPASLVWALSLQLGETKEQLKLKYDVSAKDHGTGRVTVTLTIADQGRLKPLYSVDLYIPSKDKHKSGGYMSDLSVSLAIREVDRKQVVRVHIKKELAERAQIWLRTSSLDGKREPLTSYYHVIPIAEYLKDEEQKKD